MNEKEANEIIKNWRSDFDYCDIADYFKSQGYLEALTKAKILEEGISSLDKTKALLSLEKWKTMK